MKCNFRITQWVEFNGAFGKLDVHNAYDLTALTQSPDGAVVRMVFDANQHVLKGRPKQFELLFQGVTLLEAAGVPGHLPDLAIHEVGFKAADDHEYEGVIDDGVAGDHKHLVFTGDVVGEDALIRIEAETGTVVLLA